MTISRIFVFIASLGTILAPFPVTAVANTPKAATRTVKGTRIKRAIKAITAVPSRLKQAVCTAASKTKRFITTHKMGIAVGSLAIASGITLGTSLFGVQRHMALAKRHRELIKKLNEQEEHFKKLKHDLSVFYKEYTARRSHGLNHA